ncbi:MAG: hypothetical protein ACP5J8_01355 [Minisyncoccia bacterium]
MLKSKTLVIINIILLILVIGLSLYLFVFSKNSLIKNERPAYAVYLKTGELYFGYLNRFLSQYTLTNVYLLQRDSNGGYNLQKFEQAVYQPEDKIILNKENIIWIAKIADNSPLIPILQGKQALNQAPESSNNLTTTTTSIPSTTLKK